MTTATHTRNKRSARVADTGSLLSQPTALAPRNNRNALNPHVAGEHQSHGGTYGPHTSGPLWLRAAVCDPVRLLRPHEFYAYNLKSKLNTV